MPLPLFIPILVAVLGVAAGAAVAFWPRVVGWAQDVLFPWFKRHLPALESLAREALRLLDKVVTPLHRQAKAAWLRLKPYLLKLVINIHRRVKDGYIRRVTSYLRDKLSADHAYKIVTEERVEYEELPEDVRAALMRGGRMDIDVRELRTRELELMETT